MSTRTKRISQRKSTGSSSGKPVVIGAAATAAALGLAGALVAWIRHHRGDDELTIEVDEALQEALTNDDVSPQSVMTLTEVTVVPHIEQDRGTFNDDSIETPRRGGF